jgi:hypothetical protein
LTSRRWFLIGKPGRENAIGNDFSNTLLSEAMPKAIRTLVSQL